MKVLVIETPDEDIEDQVNDARSKGFIVFIHHSADPDHVLLNDKFLYVGSDNELYEKLNLIKNDITVGDMLRW